MAETRLCASSVAEYGPCLFFQSGNFQGVEIVVKISVKNLSHRKVLSPYSSKSQLFSRAPAPSNLPESLNFHLGTKLQPADPVVALRQVLVGLSSFLHTQMAPAGGESIKIHPMERLSKPSQAEKQSAKTTCSHVAHGGCQVDNKSLPCHEQK